MQKNNKSERNYNRDLKKIKVKLDRAKKKQKQKKNKEKVVENEAINWNSQDNGERGRPLGEYVLTQWTLASRNYNHF